MDFRISTSSHLPLTERVGQGATCGDSQLERRSLHTSSIQVLDDDSLLNVFRLFRPFLLGEDEDDNARLFGGYERWVHGRWWYTLAHVCQRWRNLIFESTSYLGVSLVCTNGTPVADMLAHSPPLPLVIDYFTIKEHPDITAEDEEGAIVALRQRDRVRRVRFEMPATNLQKLVMTIDEEYPILEHLVILDRTIDNSTILIFPDTLQAPRLHHLTLIGFTLSTGSRLLTTAVGLVTLYLVMIQPSTYFDPNTLLRWLSFMPQLETFAIGFLFPVPNHDIERQLSHTPIVTPILLPNLHRFVFRGVSSYLEVLVHRITAPRLEKLHIGFFNQLTFSIPRFLQFINTTENLRFEGAKFKFFKGEVYVGIYPHGEAEMPVHAFSINVNCWHLDWQVSCTAQISNSLGQIFSEVEHLTLEHEEHGLSSEEHNEVGRTEWRKLLGSFRGVKTLRIDDGLVEELSRCLQLDDGELSLELLPELQELAYSGSGNAGDAFTSFIDARQNAGRSVTLVRSSNQRLSGTYFASFHDHKH